MCGTNENLTKHHIVPHCFVKHMELKYKMDFNKDVFPLCRSCHNLYEKYSCIKKQEIFDRLEIQVEENKLNVIRLNKAAGAAFALINKKNSIPEQRKLELKHVVKNYLMKSEITEQDLINLSKYNKLKKSSNALSKIPSKLVAEKITDYDDFAKEWRVHFLETMNPAHMPEVWKVDRKTQYVWIPKRILNQ